MLQVQTCSSDTKAKNTPGFDLFCERHIKFLYKSYAVIFPLCTIDKKNLQKGSLNVEVCIKQLPCGDTVLLIINVW